jgi:hypothetical protein
MTQTTTWTKKYVFFGPCWSLWHLPISSSKNARFKILSSYIVTVFKWYPNVQTNLKTDMIQVWKMCFSMSKISHIFTGKWKICKNHGNFLRFESLIFFNFKIVVITDDQIIRIMKLVVQKTVMTMFQRRHSLRPSRRQ